MVRETLVDHLLNRHRHDLEHLLSRLDPREQQHVENQVVQSIGLLLDALDKLDARLAIVERAVAERFGVGLDRAERRLQLVRDVGHEVAAQRFQPPQLGRIVHHEHDARARIARQRRRLNRDAHLVAAVLRGFQPLRLARGRGRAHRLVQRVIADDLQQRPAFDQRRAENRTAAPPPRSQTARAAAVDGDHALDHAAEHRRLPLVAGVSCVSRESSSWLMRLSLPANWPNSSRFGT